MCEISTTIISVSCRTFIGASKAHFCSLVLFSYAQLRWNLFWELLLRAVPRVLLENAATSKGLLLKNSVLSDLAHNDRVSSDGDAASDGSSTPGTPGPALRPRATTTTSSDLSR